MRRGRKLGDSFPWGAQVNQLSRDFRRDEARYQDEQSRGQEEDEWREQFDPNHPANVPDRQEAA